MPLYKYIHIYQVHTHIYKNNKLKAKQETASPSLLRTPLSFSEES